MSIIRISGKKGFNGKIYKSYYQCYDGRRTDYHYEVYSCTDKGEQWLGSANNYKNAVAIFDRVKEGK